MLRTQACWIALGAATLLFVTTMGGCGSDDSEGEGSNPGKGGSGGTATDSGTDGPAGSGGTGGSGGSAGESGGGGSGGDASVDPDASDADDASDAPIDVVTGDVICTPGTYQCNANTLLKCNATGTEWLNYWNCATSMLCDAAGGRCNPPACQPAEHRCVGATLEICKSDQTGWETKAVCASAAHCRAEFQTCGATPCPAGVYQCSGSVLQICNGTETGWDDVQDCQSSVLCDATNQLCSPSECAPGEISCEGATLRTCSFTLDGWQTLETCQSEQLCDEAGGQCDICTPDLYRCAGADLYHCSPNGQVESLETSCSSPERCNPVSGRCDPACNSGEPGAGINCGSNDLDCCGSPAVQGGTFSRSYDVVNYTNDTYVATVADFELDMFEVTVGRFREFVQAGLGTQTSPPSTGDGAHPLIAGSGWDSAWNLELPADTPALLANLNCDTTFQSWTDSAGTKETRPINCVTWYEAFAYCAWSGGRLPTEAEWNFAASGGDEHRVFPWLENEIDHDLAVWGCESDGVPGCAGADILEVGSRSPDGDGKWGQTDLAGSMSEWVLDKFLDPYPMPCSNCAAVTVGSGRMRRGGAWNEMNANRLRNGSRESANPNHRFTYLGFRCARSTSP